MSEMFRVLKPGGTAIITVPLRRGPTLEDPTVTTSAQRKQLFGQWDHVRFYEKTSQTGSPRAGSKLGWSATGTGSARRSASASDSLGLRLSSQANPDSAPRAEASGRWQIAVNPHLKDGG